MKIENVEISNQEIETFLNKYPTISINSKVSALLDHQTTPVSRFPTLINNMKKYKESKFGDIRIDGIDFRVFYNPTRAKNVKVSTFSDHDKNFKCFLCDLLPGQRGIKYLNGKYMIIVNPGITIPGDLTIPTVNHELQKLEPHFHDMLEIAKHLTDYPIYFNGPLAGATCPHFHFQAGLRDRLTGEKQINNLLEPKNGSSLIQDFLFQNNETEIFRMNNFLRSNFCCYTSSKETADEFAKNFFMQIKLNNKKFINNLSNIPDFGSEIKVFEEPEEEGRFNVMAKYFPKTKKYLVVFFPKVYNRPQIYFSNKPEQLTLGFAIKEALGHVLVTSKEDLNRILEDPHLIKQTYLDTSLSNEMDYDLFQNLKKLYN